MSWEKTVEDTCLLEKRRTQGIPTFAEAATRVLEQKRAGGRNRKHAREWLSSLRRLAFPRIGKVPVSEVSSADVLEILTPIWHRKAETARRVRMWSGTGWRRPIPARTCSSAAVS